jgi:hypothetical protein
VKPENSFYICTRFGRQSENKKKQVHRHIEKTARRIIAIWFYNKIELNYPFKELGNRFFITVVRNYLTNNDEEFDPGSG